MISLLDNILLSWDLVLSTFNILPLSGSIAWFFLSLPCFADPPAESPSTINNSDFAGSLSWQSASFPGKCVEPIPFLLVNSLAFLAASLAFAASEILFIIFFTSEGFSSNHWFNFSATIDSTIGLTSEDTSLSLVWLENLGSLTLIERTEVNPSLASSPVIVILFFCVSFK